MQTAIVIAITYHDGSTKYGLTDTVGFDETYYVDDDGIEMITVKVFATLEEARSWIEQNLELESGKDDSDMV